MKNFAIPGDQLVSLAQGWGGCVASDRITVDGQPVGYCYREAPINDLDSGWRFLAGDESEAYMAESSNHSIYDINTITNYDPAVISILGSPIGSAFERGSPNELVPIESELP